MASSRRPFTSRNYGAVLDDSDGKRKAFAASRSHADEQAGFICGSLLCAAVFAAFFLVRAASGAGLLDGFAMASPVHMAKPPHAASATSPGSEAPPSSALPAAVPGVIAPAAWAVPPLPGERVTLVYEFATIVGRPPLLCRADMGDVTEDAVWGEGCAHPAFFVADPPREEGGLYAYIREAEDVTRDLIVALLTSPGRALIGSGRSAADAPGGGIGAARPGSSYWACKASPVTRPHFCARPLLAASEGGSGGGGAYSRGDLWIVDVGAGVGYWALLAASLGFPSLAVDEQPHCAALTAAGVAASALGGLVTVRTARVSAAAGPGAAVEVPARGCVGTSTLPGLRPPAPAVLKAGLASTAAAGVAALGREDPERPAAPPLANASAWEAGARVPVATLDALLLDDVWAPVGAGAPLPLILLLKVDVRGRQRDTLASAGRLIAQRRVLNVLVEFNKRHTAVALRGPALDAADGSPDGSVPLSEADNDAATADLLALVQALLSAGYDVLSTDRGWLRWQDPWGLGKANEAAEMAKWARQVTEHEIDLWASLDASGGKPPPPLSEESASALFASAAVKGLSGAAAGGPRGSGVLTPEEARKMRLKAHGG